MSRTLEKHAWAAPCAVIAFSLAMAPASLAEVRSCTLGIDTNCPSGLAE